MLDGLIARRSRPVAAAGPRAGSSSGTALALGAFLDGIPEQLVLGIGIAAGDGVGVSLLVAIFVSNLPEAIGSASDMRKAGRAREAILRLWAAGRGDLRPRHRRRLPRSPTPPRATSKAAIDGFAAGALLVMLIDSMIPDARSEPAGRRAGHRPGLRRRRGASSVS